MPWTKLSSFSPGQDFLSVCWEQEWRGACFILVLAAGWSHGTRPVPLPCAHTQPFLPLGTLQVSHVPCQLANTAITLNFQPPEISTSQVGNFDSRFLGCHGPEAGCMLREAPWGWSSWGGILQKKSGFPTESPVFHFLIRLWSEGKADMISMRHWPCCQEGHRHWVCCVLQSCCHMLLSPKKHYGWPVL